MDGIQLGIVIVSWNVRELLDQCLISLYSACHDALTLNICSQTPTVIVVDNASGDDSVDMIQQQHPWVRLIASQINLGYVAANNMAIKALYDSPLNPPDAIWLLNPDTEVNKKTISELLEFMASHPKAGLIGPKLYNPDGSLQESAFRFPGLWQPMFDFGMLPQRLYFTALNGRYSKTAYESPAPFLVDHPLGAGMLVRTRTIDDVGLLDDAFFMYCEEIDWAWRMKKKGWDCWLVPNATLVHHGGASTRQAKPETTAFLWESRARLYRKHRSGLMFFLVSLLVRKYFSSQSATSPDWERTYQRIISAWNIQARVLPEVKHL